MKVNELFIGAWVMTLYGPYQVDIIYGNGKVSAGLIELDSSELNGIPITAEILEHNGFSRGKLLRYELVVNGMPLFVIPYKDDLWKVVYEWDLTRPCVNRIRFVHELQMVLTLNGIDKEIML